MLDVLFDPGNYPFWIIISSILAGAIAVIIRPFSTYTKFVYPNAKFEAIGNPFLNMKKLENLIDSKSISSFKENLSSTKDYDLSGETVQQIQKSIDKSFIQTIQMMKEDSSKKMHDFLDTYLKKLDLPLLKTTVRKKIQNEEIKEKSIKKAIYPETKNLLQKIKEAEEEELPNILEDHDFTEEIAKEISKEKIDFLKLDTLFDEDFIKKLQQVKVPYKCKEAKSDFIKTLIDIANIKKILRAKQLGYKAENCKKLYLGEGKEISSWKLEELSEVDSVSQIISALEGTSYFDILKDNIERYNQEKSVQILENALDQVFVKMAGDIAKDNYTSIGPTIRFLVSKEFEIRNLKIIVKGISERLPSKQIKSLLVTEVKP